MIIIFPTVLPFVRLSALSKKLDVFSFSCSYSKFLLVNDYIVEVYLDFGHFFFTFPLFKRDEAALPYTVSPLASDNLTVVFLQDPVAISLPIAIEASEEVIFSDLLNRVSISLTSAEVTAVENPEVV